VASASLERRELADDASSAAVVSGDGRYVAVATAARNLFPDDVVDPPGQFYMGGIFRRDLVTGAFELVALGNLVNERDGSLVRSGAANPSISRDGRYVVFSTAERLVPQDIDVYRRDMNVPRGPEAYTLVSAHDGSDVPARYAGTGAAGADVTTGMALSGDGNRVVFRTTEHDSDLPDSATVDVPPFQLFVRDIDAHTTQLVSRDRADGRPAGGATGGAGISRDGSTVVWNGLAADRQVRTLPGETIDGNSLFYLWQRLDRPTDTRRITGASDPDDPACTDGFNGSPTAQGPCFGPLSQPEAAIGGIGSTVPALSADGTHVLFLTGAPPRPLTQGIALDLFETDMSDGRSRKAGTIELTREGTSRDPVAGAPIESATLSADGRFAAIVTQRTRFLLPALHLTSDVRTTQGINDLYLVNLHAGTIERATRGFRGEDSDGNVLGTPSLSDDGTRVAFLSGATNLFFGDANGRTDAFVADWQAVAPPVSDPEEPPEAAEPLPAPTPAPPSRKLAVSVRRAPAGQVKLEVKATVAGKLAVEVRGRLPDADGRPRGSAKLLGSAKRTVRKPASVVVTVKLARKYRSRLRKAGTIAASASVVLTPKTGAARTRSITVRFRDKRA
jgi:hypothetical protein